MFWEYWPGTSCKGELKWEEPRGGKPNEEAVV